MILVGLCGPVEGHKWWDATWRRCITTAESGYQLKKTSNTQEEISKAALHEPFIMPESIFKDGKELENFPMGKNKYNDMVNTMKLMYRAVERCGKWDMEWPTNKNSVLYWSVCKYFGYPEAIEMRK